MRRTLFGTLIIVLMSAPSAWAASIVIGDPITVQLLSPGLGLPDPMTVNVNVSAGREVAEGDGSEIGSGAMLDGEFIDVSTASIVFSIYGGGADLGGGATTTGYEAGANYLLTGLVNPSLGFIASASLVFNNIVGVTLGNQLIVGPHSIQLFLDTLGVVFDGVDNIGTVTVNLTFQDANGTPNPVVPEPATLVLVGSGAVLAWRRRRSRPGARV